MMAPLADSLQIRIIQSVEPSKSSIWIINRLDHIVLSCIVRFREQLKCEMIVVGCNKCYSVNGKLKIYAVQYI